MEGLEPISIDDVISALEKKSGEKASDATGAVEPLSLADASTVISGEQQQ